MVFVFLCALLLSESNLWKFFINRWPGLMSLKTTQWLRESKRVKCPGCNSEEKLRNVAAAPKLLK